MQERGAGETEKNRNSQISKLVVRLETRRQRDGFDGAKRAMPLCDPKEGSVFLSCSEEVN